MRINHRRALAGNKKGLADRRRGLSGSVCLMNVYRVQNPTGPPMQDT
jgi:hypothetical protein